MALLVKEKKALIALEEAIVVYYKIMLDEDLVIDTNKSIEERILSVAQHIQLLL
jgi:hypothetical protein